MFDFIKRYINRNKFPPCVNCKNMFVVERIDDDYGMEYKEERCKIVTSIDGVDYASCRYARWQKGCKYIPIDN